jgi:5,5'-dehydrodivanillate O-demethylase
MGPPEKQPLLPRWETFAREGVHRSIALTNLPCNWLQCMENSMDPVHFEWLHANQMNWVREKRGLEPTMFPARHQKVAFPLYENFGIFKRRLLVGDDPNTSPDWQMGHPVLFPNILSLGGQVGHSFQIRVPVDDGNTWHVNVGMSLVKEGETPTVTVREAPCFNEDGSLIIDQIIPQDMMAWITQGRWGVGIPGIAPRYLEHLGVSDRGIILYRNILMDAMDAVARGDDPPGLVYDVAKNTPMMVIPHSEGPERAAFNMPGVSADGRGGGNWQGGQGGGRGQGQRQGGNRTAEPMS